MDAGSARRVTGGDLLLWWQLSALRQMRHVCLAEAAEEARVAEQVRLVEVARVAEARVAGAERLAEQVTAGWGGG